MSIQTLSVLSRNDTDANFRTWGSAISTALAAAGLVQTSDTGQINWTTVVRATAERQSRGFEIWRFNDALQSTHPVFIRLDYGAGYGIVNHPGVFMAIGTATDGAGRLMSHASYPNSTMWEPGALTIPASVTGHSGWLNQQVITSDMSSLTANPLYVASDGGSSMMIAGWFNAAGASNAAYTGMFGLIERTRDFDGTPNGNGVFVVRSVGNSGPTNGTMLIGRTASFVHTNFPTYGGVPAVVTGVRQALSPASGVAGGNTSVFPIFTGVSPGLGGPSKHVVSVYSADQAVNTQFDVAGFYGATATFRSIGAWNSAWSNDNTGAVTGAFRVA